MTISLPIPCDTFFLFSFVGFRNEGKVGPLVAVLWRIILFFLSFSIVFSVCFFPLERFLSTVPGTLF